MHGKQKLRLYSTISSFSCQLVVARRDTSTARSDAKYRNKIVFACASDRFYSLQLNSHKKGTKAVTGVVPSFQILLICTFNMHPLWVNKIRRIKVPTQWQLLSPWVPVVDASLSLRDKTAMIVTLNWCPQSGERWREFKIGFSHWVSEQRISSRMTAFQFPMSDTQYFQKKHFTSHYIVLSTYT